MAEAGRYPNIEILTLTEVINVEGEAGNFKVKLKINPRYVDLEKCTACGDCRSVCPRLSIDKYNANLTFTRAIRIDFPQAVPTAYYIDKETCLNLNHETCTLCINICGPKAIDFSQEPEIREIEVGAILLAPGFGSVPQSALQKYGYGKYEDVMTSIEMERLMCVSGPTQGHIIRPSDFKPPKKIAYIQCVGSRDITCDRLYCSCVCCMYAVKQASVIKEHEPDAEFTFFYIDIRTQNKGFDAAFKNIVNRYGFRIIRAKPGKVEKIGDKLYFINCRLQIGDGAEETWVADTEKQVRCLGLRIKNYGALKLGTKYGEYGQNGCMFEMDDLGNAWGDNIVEGAGKFYGYNSYIRFKRDSYRGTVFYGTGEFLGCLLEGTNGPLLYFRGSYSIKHCFFSLWGRISIQRTQTEMDEIRFHHFKYGGLYLGYTHGTNVVEVKNIKYSSINQWAWLVKNQDATLRLINAQSPDLSKIAISVYDGYKDRFEFWYELKFFVHDKELNPIGGASIKLYDKNNNLAFSGGTDVNGICEGKVMVAYKMNNSGTLIEEELNPFTLEVEHSNYAKYTSKITIDKPINQDITLDALSYTVDEIYALLEKHDKRMTAFKFLKV